MRFDGKATVEKLNGDNSHQEKARVCENFRDG